MRRRLVLAIALVATTAVLLLALPLVSVLAGAHRNADLLALQRDTLAATRQIDISDRTGDPIELPASNDTLAVYASDNRRRAGTGPATAPDVVRRALRSGRATEAPGGGALTVAVPLIAHERVVGAVRAVRAEGEAGGDVVTERLTVAGLAVGIILAAVGAALLLGRALSRPLERLAGAATRLGHGDFSARSPHSGIPEVDSVTTALATTAERLEQLISRERAFSADASHQLRTPLQALRIELEAAQLRGHDLPEIETALAQVDRLETTITTLLTVARDVSRPAATADVGACVEAARSHWHGVLAAASRPLRVTSPTGPLTADAHPDVVREILNVLLDNAYHHGKGVVSIRARRLQGWVVIDVADEGPGFVTEDTEEAFVRAAPSPGGHGIGLALARSLAHAEGGRLTVTRPRPDPVLTLFLHASGHSTDETGEEAPEDGSAPAPAAPPAHMPSCS
jgi:signal transduction histidine kinase